MSASFKSDNLLYLPTVQILNLITFGLPALVSAISAVFLLTKKDRTHQQFILGEVCIFLTFSNVTLSCYMLGIACENPILDLASIFFTMIVAPTYALYIVSVTNVHGIVKSHWIFFLPLIVVFLANVVIDSIMGWEGTVTYLDNLYNKNITDLNTLLEKTKNVVDSNLYRMATFTQNVAAVIYGRIEVKRYVRNQSEYYSNRGEEFLSPERLMVMYAEILTVAMLLLCVAPFTLTRNYPVFMSIIGTAYAISIGMIAHWGYVLKGTKRELIAMMNAPIKEIEEEKKKEIEVPKKTYLEAINRGLQQFIEEKAYLDPNLTADQMAAMLGTNRVYLSDALRTFYHETFSAFINRTRIEYAADLIDKMEDSEDSIKSIAIASGYNNSVSFYRNFMKVKGVSPSDWKKGIRQA